MTGSGNAPKHIPVRDLAKRLSCSPRTLKKGLRAGTIPGIKSGNEWRVNPEAVILALSNQPPPQEDDE